MKFCSSGVFSTSLSQLDERTEQACMEIKVPGDRAIYSTDVITKGKGGRCIPSRYICVILGFLCCLTLTTQRVNLSMALVAMVNQTAVYQGTESNSTESDCPSSVVEEHSNDQFQHKESGSYLWDSTTQNYIVSAGFLGFFLMQAPGGRLSEILGAKQVLIFSLVIASLCTAFSPLVSDSGAYVFMGIHFIKGLSQGLTQPALACLLSRWIPKPEKSFLASFTFSGYPAGSIFAGLISGVLCDSEFLDGWPMVFYVFGFMGLFLAVLVFFFTFNTPDEDKRITEAEYKYICSNIDVNQSHMKLKVPWKPILSTVGTWAAFLALMAQLWCVFFFQSVFPSYLGAVLHFTHTENGYLNSFPYIGQLIVIWSASYLSDVLINKGYLSTVTVRKVCSSLGCIGFSLSLISATYAGCNKMLASICFTIAIVFTGFGNPGSFTVPMDMTRNFAGTLMGMATTFASTSGFIIPLIVASITSAEQTLSKWSTVFYISAAVVMFDGVAFVIFGAAKRQKWDSSTEDKLRVNGSVNEAFEGSPDESPNRKVPQQESNSC